MKHLEIPAPRDDFARGVIVETVDLAGLAMTMVTIRPRAGQPCERTWYPDDAAGFAYALGQADTRHLPLFDLRHGEAE